MILSCSSICKSFGSDDILKNASFHIEEHEKAAVVGINGAGKSTLLKIITGELPADSGEVVISKGKTLGYLAQNQDLLSHRTIYDEMLEVKRPVIEMEERLRELEVSMKLADGEELEAMMDTYSRLSHQFDLINGYAWKSEIVGVLKGLGFPEEEFGKQISTLSGGQKTRVSLGKLLLTSPDIILLDEPTNHLDIYTRENLTEALMAYTGTLLMVTHDRHLMNSLGCPILYLEDGKATLYPSYDALMGRATPAAAPEKAGDQPAKAGYGKEQRRRRAELRAKIKACEDEMEACGAREVELDNEINSPEVYNDPDLLRQKSDELSDLRFHQEELFAAWEKAMEEQEQYEQAAGEE